MGFGCGGRERRRDGTTHLGLASPTVTVRLASLRYTLGGRIPYISAAAFGRSSFASKHFTGACSKKVSVQIRGGISLANIMQPTRSSRPPAMIC